MKSRKDQAIDIADYYSINIRQMWCGLKQESPAFWWLCIYIFFEYVHPQVIYPSLDIIPWAKLTLLLAVATTFFDKSINLTGNIQNKLLVMLFFVVLLSSTFSFRPATSFSNIDLVFNWVILYFLITLLANTEKRFFILVLLFLLVSFKMSQHGFRSFASRGFSFASWGVTGSPGWFQNSGEFGIQMTIFVPLSIAFILALKQYWGRLKRLFFYLMPFTGIVSIAASSSRGAQLAIIVVGIWFALKSRMGVRALVGILLIGWALYSVLPPEQLERFHTMGEDQTSVARLEYWRFGLEIVRNHPLFGIGYRNWLQYCWFEDPFANIPDVQCRESHNVYVESASELGIPGFLLFVSMLILIFRQNNLTQSYMRQTDNRFLLNVAYGLNGGLVGFMISSFFIAVFVYPFFWVQLAMTVALNNIAKKQYSEFAMKLDSKEVELKPRYRPASNVPDSK